MPSELDLLLRSNPQLLIAAMVVAVFVLSCGVFAVLLHWRNGPRAISRRRVAAIIGAGQGRTSKQIDASGVRRRQVQERLQEIEAREKRSRRRNVLRRELEQSGFGISMRTFILGSIIFGLLVGAAGTLSGVSLAISGVAGFATGLGLPRWLVRFMGRRRRKAFTSQFAGAVDVIVRGVQSGLPSDECFNIIARETPDPVGHEFRLIVEGQRLGLSLEDALNRAYDRTPTPELKFFATVLTIQRQTGGNLAETLSNLSEVLRDRQKMAGRVRALSSEARASAMIIGCLPFAVGALLFVVNTAYIKLMFTDPIGHLMVAGGIGIMVIGSLIMKKMVSFEI
jgi:tight adherence protein B